MTLSWSKGPSTLALNLPKGYTRRMGDIFVAQAGEQRGPFTELEILRMVENGELSRADFWWRDGMAGWESLVTLLPPPFVPPQPHFPMPPPLPAEEEAQPVRPKSRTGLYIGLFAGAFLLVGLIFVGAVISVFAVGARSSYGKPHGRSSSPEASHPAATPPASWQTISLKDVTIKSPVALKSFELPIEGTKAGETKKLIVSSYALQGQSEALWIGFIVIDYVPDAVLSLEAAEKGAMQGMAAKLHTSVPEYTATNLTVHGYPARRIDSAVPLPLVGTALPITLRLLLVKSGQRLIQVITIQYKAGEADDAESILSSLTIPSQDS